MLLCLFSCTKAEKGTIIPENMGELISQNPDSALQVLNSLVISPGDEYTYNRFMLYLVEAKEKSEKDISYERDIISTFDYFQEKGDVPNACLSAYYSGRVLQSCKEYQKAMDYYRIAESYAIRNKDKNFHGLILYATAELMLDQLLFEDTQLKLEEAKRLFEETNNQKYIIKVYKLSAICNLLLGKNSDAILLYNEALEKAKAFGDKREMALINSDLGIACYEKGEYEKSLEYLTTAIAIDSIVCESGKIFHSLAKTYLKMEDYDSARFSANLSLEWVRRSESNRTNILILIFKFLAEIEEKEGNYTNALAYHKQYSHYMTRIVVENRNSAIANADRKYRFEIVKNENTKLILKQLRLQVLLLILLLCVAIAVTIYYRTLLKKNKQLNKANLEISNLAEEIQDIGNIKTDFDATRKIARNNLIHSFNILQRAAALEYLVQKSGDKQSKLLVKKFNEIAYGSYIVEWDVLYTIMNTIHENFLDKLNANYKDLLDETELRVCCLIYSKMNSQEIAVILQLSVNTVHAKTTSIRKKFGVEKYGSIIEFLDELRK